MAHWKDRFTYNSKSAVEHEVNGGKLRFYPNRIGLLAELAEVSKPVAHALSALFGDGRNDTTSISESYKDKPKKDIKSGVETAESVVDKITVEALSPEIAGYRRKERDTAIDELLDGLTNERNRLLFGRLLMDSLRDEFSYKKDRPAPEVEEFLFGDGEKYEGLDTPMLVQMVTGWLKANAKVFGSVGEKMAGLVKGKLEALDPQSETMTSTADGSSSRTLSLVRSDSDSESSGLNS